MSQTYRSRTSVLENEATWTLAPDALERAEAGAPTQRLPYRDIVELRLVYDPTRFDTNRYRCDLTPVTGRRATLKSTHYVSVGNFEDRAASYSPFVRELVRRVGEAAPRCRFRAGKRAWVFWAEHIFLLTTLLLLAGVLMMIGNFALPTIATIKLAIIATYIPIVIKYATRNWPRAFSPDDVPPDVLP
jgi:hypothetical protein